MSAEDFAIKDYELKINYMTNHLGRMWTRFNYLMGIQTAIAGGKFVLSPDKNGLELSAIGFVFAMLWYMLGAQDRYLFELYREQVKQAFLNIKVEKLPKGSEAIDLLHDLSYVGQVKPINKDIKFKERLEVKMAWHKWRMEGISSTKMAAIVPMVIGVLWVVYICIQILFILNQKSIK